MHLKCPGKMSASTIALMRLLFFIIVLQNGQEVFSTTVTCARRFYPIDNACKLCPAHCNVCTNATHCSLCQMGYYGPICQNTCEIGCSGTCHKLYGHCTYGCPDGKYADDKSPACLNCSSQCKLCSSLTSCVECNSGYYGNTCMKRCLEHCKAGLCNSTDGACFECKKEYFKMDKECVLCPDGCAHCNDSHMCTVCNSGFISPIHGKCLLDCPTMNGDEQESICHQGLCQNLPAYWKLTLDACNQAHPSDCVTEGLCVVLKSRQLGLERTSPDNKVYSLLYMHLKCSFECTEHVTLNFTDPCKGHVCKSMCDLDKPLYSDTYVIASYGSIGDTPPLGTSINSHCTQGRLHDSTEKTGSATVLVVVTITVIVTFIVIGVLVFWVLYKRRSVIKKENTDDNELSTLENVELTIPLSTNDEDLSSVKAQCIVEKDELFPKSTSEHDDDDDDDISDMDPYAESISPSESAIIFKAPGTVPEPEPEMREIHKPQDDGSSYMDTGTMPSEFGAQLKFKPYDTQQLSPSEIWSGIATKSKPPAPYARYRSNTYVVRKGDLTYERAQQIFDEQCEKYM